MDDLKASIAEALEESEYVPEDERPDGWEDWDENDAPAAAAGDEESASKSEPQATSEDDSESLDTVDPADSYWGVSLEGIPAEKRADIIAHFEQQDSTIHKLQERLTREPEPEVVDDTPAEEVTDEDLMRVLGIDPESYEAQSLAPTVLPLARTVLALEETVEQLKMKDVVEDTKTTWNSQLDVLEQSYGKLPFDRVQVLRYAAEEKLVTPADAYFKLATGPRREVEDRVSAARLEAAKKDQSAGTRPRATGGVREPIDPKTTSLKDAVRIAMKEAEEDTGLSFKGLLSGKKVRKK